jgi:hypothetical protein
VLMHRLGVVSHSSGPCTYSSNDVYVRSEQKKIRCMCSGWVAPESAHSDTIYKYYRLQALQIRSEACSMLHFKHLAPIVCAYKAVCESVQQGRQRSSCYTSMQDSSSRLVPYRRCLGTCCAQLLNTLSCSARTSHALMVNT